MPFDIIPDEYVVTTPPPGPNGINSERVVFASVKVPAHGSQVFPYGTYEEYVYPLGAVSLPHVGQTTCNTATVWTNDGLARVGVNVGTIKILGNIPISQDWRLVLQIRATCGCFPMAMRQYEFEFVPPGAISGSVFRSGTVATYQGPLCTQFEVWGNVNTIQGGVPVPADLDMTMSFTMIVDRVASGEASITGIGVADMGKSVTLPGKY